MTDRTASEVPQQFGASRLGVRGWMLFDWAAQPFFTVIVTFVFGPYFVARMTDEPV